VLNDAFKVVVLADEFDSRAGADTLDGVKVIAAEEDAEVDKLRLLASFDRLEL
jgi:hypothetical protein